MVRVETHTDTIKELLIANMPPYPVKRSYLVAIYGQGVVGALNDLMAENKVLRAKRGYYTLSDELLDTYEHHEEEDTANNGLTPTVFMPTETLKIIIGAWVSQFTVNALLTYNLGGLLTEVPYYTTTVTGDKDGQFHTLLTECCENITRYRLTDEGEQLRNLLLAGLE